MKKDADGEVTHYPNRYYESTLGSGSTKYFYADGQLVSFERSPGYGDAYGRRFVFRDHPSTALRTSLGSTSVIANGSGVRIWEDRYLPFGDVRFHSDTVTNTVQTQTLRCTQGYTGQWLEEGLAASPEGGLDRGLYDYGVRWYDASLGRFVQADTIVPEPGNPQGLNRYSYVLNNPIKYTDPSGHAECVDESCDIVFESHGRRLIPRGRGATSWYYQSGLEMVGDWLAESGPQTRYYGASAPMTRDLMRDEGVQQARENYYSTGKPSYRYRFTDPQQPYREASQWANGEDQTGIGSVLGSYQVHIYDNDDGTLAFWVINRVSRESGTRLLGTAPSLEDMIASGEVRSRIEALTTALDEFVSGDGSLGEVQQAWPRSILNSTNRGEPSSTGLPGVWGGNMDVWFMWTEPLCVTCG